MRVNRFVKDFFGTIEAKFADDSSVMPMSVWISGNTSLRKRPFSFEGYEFQRQICDDMHPSLYCKKCSQVGLTEVQLRKFLAFLKRNTATVGIFTLPSEKMFKRVSVTRAKPLIEGEPVFNQNEIKPTRQMSLYQIDQSFAYFTGMTEDDATSINADILFHDELDLSEQQMVGLYQSRLQNSDHKITQNFSTPKYTGYGVDKGFANSDQHEYLARCPRCRHWNLPVYARPFVQLPGLSDSIDLFEIDPDHAAAIDWARASVVCEKCHSSLPLGDPSTREWVARHPGRLTRGYNVSPFATNRISLQYIVQQLLKMRELDNLAGFHNTVLGEPYDSSNARLTEADIRACMRGAAVPEIGDQVFVGIDMGLISHIVVGRPDLIFEWKTVPADDVPAEIGRLLEKYDVVAGCVDRHPYTPTANILREISNGRIMPVEYRGTVSINLRNDEFDRLSHLQVNRTLAIDAVANLVRNHRLAFVGYQGQDRIIIDHLRDMVRVEEPEQPAVWNKLTGQDHYFHALVFLFSSIKAAELLNFLGAEDDRSHVLFGTVNNLQHSAAHLGVKSRMHTTTSLGTN